MIRKYSNLFSGGLFLGLALLLGISIPTIKRGKLDSDPRLFPVIVVVLLTVFGGLLLISGLRSFSHDHAKEAKKAISGAALRVALSITFFAVFALALQTVGFLIAGFAYLFAMFFLLVPAEKRNPLKLAVVSAVTVLLIWLIFAKGFGLSLPVGSVFRRLLH